VGEWVICEYWAEPLSESLEDLFGRIRYIDDIARKLKSANIIEIIFPNTESDNYYDDANGIEEKLEWLRHALYSELCINFSSEKLPRSVRRFEPKPIMNPNPGPQPTPPPTPSPKPSPTPKPSPLNPNEWNFYPGRGNASCKPNLCIDFHLPYSPPPPYGSGLNVSGELDESIRDHESQHGEYTFGKDEFESFATDYIDPTAYNFERNQPIKDCITQIIIPEYPKGIMRHIHVRIPDNFTDHMRGFTPEDLDSLHHLKEYLNALLLNDEIDDYIFEGQDE
jgi:hypothetical protein